MAPASDVFEAAGLLAALGLLVVVGDRVVRRLSDRIGRIFT